MREHHMKYCRFTAKDAVSLEVVVHGTKHSEGHIAYGIRVLSFCDQCHHTSSYPELSLLYSNYADA